MSDLKVVQLADHQPKGPTKEDAKAAVVEFFDTLEHVPDIIILGTFNDEHDTLVHTALQLHDDDAFRGLQQLGMLEMMKQAAIARNFSGPED